MKVVVTGAAGRVGRAVLADLKATGDYTITAADRILPPSGLAQQSLLTDLSDSGSVYGALTGADAVIHLGAYPDTSHHPSEEVFINNSAASANVAAACIAFGIKRIVYAISITTYGLGYQARDNGITALPTDETISTRPDDFYALSKHVGEDIFTLGASEHGLHVASLRIAASSAKTSIRGSPRETMRTLRSDYGPTWTLGTSLRLPGSPSRTWMRSAPEITPTTSVLPIRTPLRRSPRSSPNSSLNLASWPLRLAEPNRLMGSRRRRKSWATNRLTPGVRNGSSNTGSGRTGEQGPPPYWPPE